MTLQLAIECDKDRYWPGDTVRGRVRVLEGGRSPRLTVALNYCERTAAHSEVARALPVATFHDGDLTTGAVYDFSIALPPSALPNYESAHGELCWELDAKADRFGRDARAKLRIEVLASRREP